jgi:tetratricopeptide (TPR) repeat protein
VARGALLLVTLVAANESRGQALDVAAFRRLMQDALGQGMVDSAVRAGRRFVRTHPREPEGFLLLGDAYMRRFPSGRFRAMEFYRTAQRLGPESPEPPYRLAVAGLYIGGADGERIAREGLLRVLALDPLYPTAWEKWHLLYRGAAEREHVIRLFEAHESSPVLDRRRAQLLIETERYAEADSLLDRLVARDADNGTWLALRAQGQLEAGATTNGLVLYGRALDRAHRDPDAVLWSQVIGIATPDEFAEWERGVPDSLQGTWLSAFWARRNPNLFAGANHRIAEHFRRLRYARRRYPLLHPMVAYHRDAAARAMNLEPSHGERTFHLRCEVYQGLAPSSGMSVALPGVSHASDRAAVSMGVLAHLTDEEKADVKQLRRSLRFDQLPVTVQRAIQEDGQFAFAPTQFAPMGLDLRNLDSVGARIGYNLAAGLDDRGLMYLRFGKPDAMVLGGDNSADPRCSTDELERWRYDDLGEVRFAKPNAFSGATRVVPEMVVRPMNAEQFRLTGIGLTRDATSVPAPLSFGIWTTQFRSLTGDGRTDLLVVSTRGRLAVQLVAPRGAATETRENRTGRVVLAGVPGRHALLAHVLEESDLGRQHLGVVLRDFVLPATSDVLIAVAWGTVPDSVGRAEMMARSPRDLRVPVGSTVRSYAEAYGLRERGGLHRLRVRYLLRSTTRPNDDIRLEHLAGATVFEFERTVVATPDGVTRLALDIQPRHVPRGTYLLRLEVSDLVAGANLPSSTIAFQVH